MMLANLFRISAILYEDSYGVKENSVKKLAMLPFLNNENKNLTLKELREIIKNEYEMNFNEDEIRSVIIEDSSFIKTKTKNNLLISLNESTYLSQRAVYSEDKIIKYLEEYFQKYTTEYGNEIQFKEFKELLIGYLYDMYNGEKKELDMLFNIKKWSLKSTSYTEEQVRLINGFFEWDNEDKNFEIYKIASLALEYFLITTNIMPGEVSQLFSNKKFYLDTNVLIRLLGTDGLYYASQTRNFLNRMVEKKVQILLSTNVLTEYNNLTGSMIKKIRNFINEGSIVPPEALDGQIDDSFLGFYRLFYTWFQENGTKNLSLFQSTIEVFIEESIEKYNVIVEESDELDTSKAYINEMCESLSQYKRKEYSLNDIDRAVYVDVSSVANIEKKRKKQNTSIFEEEYFLITFDSFLLNWSRKNKNFKIPVVTKPSTWFTLSLKFDSRASKSDYASFVSYLTKAIPNVEKVAIEKNKIILNEIVKYTDLANEQRRILKNTINKIGISIINSKPDDELEVELAKTVKSEYKALIDDRIGEIEEQKNAEIQDKDNEIKELRDFVMKTNEVVNDLKNDRINERKEQEDFKNFYNRFWKYILFILYFLASGMITFSVYLIISQMISDNQKLFPLNEFGLYLASENKYILYLVYLIPMNFIASLIFKYGIKWTVSKFK